MGHAQGNQSPIHRRLLRDTRNGLLSPDLRLGMVSFALVLQGHRLEVVQIISSMDRLPQHYGEQEARAMLAAPHAAIPGSERVW